MEADLNLKLAVAETCGLDRCQVKMVDDGRSITARYSARMLNRMKIYPGQLVAVDTDLAEPEIAWRWHRGRVIAAPEGISLEDPGGHRYPAVAAAWLETAVTAGDEVFFTGFDMDRPMEIHAKIDHNLPTHADQIQRQVFPRVLHRLANMPAA